jgi:threonine/homoserine/homoserine lactone efflux protein
MAKHLDRRDELVEVHVQYPAPHAPLLPDRAPPYIAGAGLGWLLVPAWSHAVLSLAYLLVLVTGLHGARRLLVRRKVRRALDATTGAVLLGFAARLATEHV